MNRKQMIARIKAVTKGFRKPAGSDVKEDETKAMKIAKSICGKMGGKGSANELALVAALELTTGEKIKQAYDKITIDNPNAYIKYLRPLVCVVPLVSYGGHTYTPGLPVVINLPAYGYKQDGTVGNNLSAYKSQDGIIIRLATDEEIDKLTDAQVNAMIAEYTY